MYTLISINFDGNFKKNTIFIFIHKMSCVNFFIIFHCAGAAEEIVLNFNTHRYVSSFCLIELSYRTYFGHGHV